MEKGVTVVRTGTWRRREELLAAGARGVVGSTT
jgi:hypothetical protein